jgi:NitT/TauT family transport system ATP-binding protein
MGDAKANGAARSLATMEAKSISHRFSPSGPLVLDDVSLAVRTGEFVALLGASGCGKTTYLSILSGLIDPTAGSVWVNGEDVTATPTLSRTIVFQSDRLFPWRTALRNVTFGLEVRGDGKADARRRGEDALRLVGLGGHLDAYPRQLSGGMRQRVNVARALVMAPDFLLMDEPFASLDAQTREVMQLELLRILSTTDVGVVLVTHQIEEALYLADRVVVMAARPGRITRVIDVPFSRPRDLRVKRLPEFQRLYDDVWSEIEDDVMAGAMGDFRAEQAAG